MSASVVQQKIQSTNRLLTQSGNRVVVEFGNQAVGLVQSCRLSEDYGLQPASGIGDANAQEYVPGLASYSIAVQMMQLISNGMRALGAFPENSDAVLDGLVFNIVVYSKDTGNPLRRMIGCSYASGDTDINANRIIMTSGVLRCLDVKGTGL